MWWNLLVFLNTSPTRGALPFGQGTLRCVRGPLQGMLMLAVLQRPDVQSISQMFSAYLRCSAFEDRMLATRMIEFRNDAKNANNHAVNVNNIDVRNH